VEELQIEDDDTPQAKKKAPIAEHDLKEIQKVNEQNEKTMQVNNVTANFGNFNLGKGDVFQLNEEDPTQTQQMFTSMSDIGFPANIHNYNLKINK